MPCHDRLRGGLGYRELNQGFEADYAGLTDYFKSVRATFDDRSIRRGIIIVATGK